MLLQLIPRLRLIASIAVVLAFITPNTVAASTYRWIVANGEWNNPANWTVVEGPAVVGYPNLPEDVAQFDASITDNKSVTIPNGVVVTIGRLSVADNMAVFISPLETGELVFDNGGADAVVALHGTASFLSQVTLAANLSVMRTGSLGVAQFRTIGETGGPRSVNMTGVTVTYGAGPKTYTGATNLLEGVFTATSTLGGFQIPGPFTVGDGTGAAESAQAIVVNNLVNPAAPVTVRSDGRLTWQLLGVTANVGDLTIVDGLLNVTGTSGRLRIASLTMTGGTLRPEGFDNRFVLLGDLTATSSALGSAMIASGPSAQLELTTPTHTLTIADGPQPIDFRVDAGVTGTVGQGFTKQGAGVALLAGASTFSGTATVASGTLLVDANLSPAVFTVAGGRLGGTGGTVGAVNATTGAIAPGGVTPGAIGILTTGNLTLTSGAELAIDIASPSPGVGYDSLAVVGSITLGNATLSLSATTLLPFISSYTIVANDQNDPIVGIFAGLPEGAAIATANGTRFAISYAGGDGNDVVLTNTTPVTYYLSEGATGAFFDEDILIANPNPTAAPVTLTFFLTGGGTITQQRIVPAQARMTIHVDEIPGLEATSASALVTSDDRPTLAVERTMFWDSTHYGGHTANAVSSPATQWHFAEGAQNAFFQTYLLLANPNAAPTQATVTFLRENEAPVTEVLPLPAQSRTTLYAGDYPALVGRSFGMTIDAGAPITTERAMYFASTPTRQWSGGHDNVGAPLLSTSWFHPEGASGTFFSTFILLSNPQDSPAAINLRFLLPDGQTIDIPKTIPARQRLTVNPAGEGNPLLENAAFATVVTSNVPIVSERAMYWPEGTTIFGEGHASSGLTDTALRWALAEGRTGGGAAYVTYLLLANPNATAADVTVTFLRESGTPVSKTYTVLPNARFNIDVGAMVPELQNDSFGARIEVTNNIPIVVERSMYWNADGILWSGGTNALGTIIP